MKHISANTGRALSTIQSTRSPASTAMAKLHINSKLRMNSGHEIPILGYGRLPARPATLCALRKLTRPRGISNVSVQARSTVNRKRVPSHSQQTRRYCRTGHRSRHSIWVPPRRLGNGISQ